MGACWPPAIISASVVELKSPLCIKGPCDTVRHGHRQPVELQIFHQTVNLTYFAEAQAEGGGGGWLAVARPHYLFFLSDLLLALTGEIVVNLSGT